MPKTGLTVSELYQSQRCLSRNRELTPLRRRQLGSYDFSALGQRAHFTPRGLPAARHQSAIGARKQPLRRHMFEGLPQAIRDDVWRLHLFGSDVDGAEHDVLAIKLP